MRLFHILLLFGLFSLTRVSAQDSLRHKKDTLPTKKEDSTHDFSYASLDSLKKKYHHRTDSLQRSYASHVKWFDRKIDLLICRRDSLHQRGHGTDSLSQKIDSLQHQRVMQLNELNAKVSRAKKETLDKAAALHLPPEAKKELDSFTKNIKGFSVPDNFAYLPKMSMLRNSSMPSLNLPSNLSLSSDLAKLSVPSANLPSFRKLSPGSMQLPSLDQMKGSLGNDIKKLQALQKTDAKAVEKEAMNLAKQNKEVKSLFKEEEQLKDLKEKASSLNAKKADSLALQQLQPAVNHFAGKELELKAAMDKVSKLKQKYSSVKSLAELPKRAPNPLKGKPWIERIIPGLNYFIQNKHYTLIDFNPYVGWKFNPKFSATLGWNQRIGIDDWSLHTNQYDRLFGVRGTANYRWVRGINFKVAPEVMNAYVPTVGTKDAKHQSTVWGVYAGIRKDYSIYKSLKGYSEFVYNFTQKTHRNIYGDPLSFRFGLELQLKKKVKKSN